MSTFIEKYQQRLNQLIAKWSASKIQKGGLDILLQLVLDDRSLEGEYKNQLALGRANSGLYHLLARIYQPAFDQFHPVAGGEVKLSRADDFAACVIGLPPGARFSHAHVLGQAGKRDAVSDKPLIKHTRPYDIQGPKVPKYVTEFYGDIRGGDVLAMRGLGIQGGNLVLDAVTANYGQVVDTCDCLTTEAYLLASLMEVGELEKCTIDEALECLPWRRHLHIQEGGIVPALLRPRHRAAGLGMACLTVLAPGSVQTPPCEVRAVWVKRGANVAVLSDIFHVVPAGMVACMETGNVEPRDMLTLMYKEFLEELFDDKDAEMLRGRSDIESHVTNNIKDRLYPNDPDGRLVTIAQTGLAVDLTNLRLEICMLNLISNPAVTTDLMQHNWENLKIETGLERPDAPREDRTTRSFAPSDWVQSGACAWLLGMKWLEQSGFCKNSLR